MKYFGAASTDVGISKQINQDSLCLKIAETEKYGQVTMVLICDGMGGLAMGELASATVTRRFSEWFEEELPDRLDSYNWESLRDEWKQMIKAENRRILDYGKGRGVNLGTTVTALLVIEEQYMAAHVGDTRLYEVKDVLIQLTKDQTFVAREIDSGRMTLEEAKSDPRRNVLLQCVGASQEVEPEFIFGEVQKNTVYLICSDGFRHVLSGDEIYEAFHPNRLKDRNTIEKTSTELIEEVKRRNEKDNISVAVVKSVE